MESYHTEVDTRFNLTPLYPSPNSLSWPRNALPTHDAALKHIRRNTFPPKRLATAAADVGTVRLLPNRAAGSATSRQQGGSESTPQNKHQSVQCVLCQVALHSNEDIRDHLSTQQHSEAILQHPEVRLQDILLPESFVSEALRQGVDPTSEPSKSAAQPPSGLGKRGQVWSSENQQEEVNQIHQTSFKISDSMFELAKRMKLDVTPTQHPKPFEVPNHRLTAERPPTAHWLTAEHPPPAHRLTAERPSPAHRLTAERPSPTHQQISDLGPRYGLGRLDGGVLSYDSSMSESSIPRYDSGRSETNVPGYDSGRFKSNVSGYSSRKPNSAGFTSSLPRYKTERPDRIVQTYESESSITTERDITKNEKFESTAPTYEFGRSETRYNSGHSGVHRSSEAMHDDSGRGVPSNGVGRLEASGSMHMPEMNLVKETVLYCKVCDIAVPNQFHWEFHAKTQKHLQNMRLLEEAKELEKGEIEREKRDREEEQRKRVRAEEKEKERERMEEEERRSKILEEEKRREKEKRDMEGRGRVETQRQGWGRTQEGVAAAVGRVADKVRVNRWNTELVDSAPKVTSTNQQQDSLGALPSFSTEGTHCHICNFTIQNSNYWKAHVSSQRHTNRAANGLRTELLPTRAMVDLHESPFSCVLCDISTNNESTFALHMEGKRHRHNLGLQQSFTLNASQPQSSVVVSSSAAVQPIRSVFKLAEEALKSSEPFSRHPAIDSSRQQSVLPTHTTTTALTQTHKPFVSMPTTSVQQEASANTSAQVKGSHSSSVTHPQGRQLSEQGTQTGKVIRLKRPWRKNRVDHSSSVVSNGSNPSVDPTVARSTKEHHAQQQTVSQEVRSPTSSTQLVLSTLDHDQRQQSPIITTQQQPASTTTVQQQTQPLTNAQLIPVHSSTMLQASSAGTTVPSQDGAKRVAAKCKLKQKALRSRVESSQRPEPVSTTVSKVIATGHVSHSNAAIGAPQQWQQPSPQLQHRSPLPSRRNEFRSQSGSDQPDLDRWEYEADKVYPDSENYEMGAGSYEEVGVERYEEVGDESYKEKGVGGYEGGGEESYELDVERYEEVGGERYEVEGDESYGVGDNESYGMGKSGEHYRPEDFEGDALEFEIHPDTPDFDQYQDNTLSFDLHAKLNPKSSGQHLSSESHTRVFGPDSWFRKESSQLDFNFDSPQHGFSSTQATAPPRPHNGSKDWRFDDADSTHSGSSSADLKQSHFANSLWSSRPPPFKGPRPSVNSPSRPGSVDRCSNSSQSRSPLALFPGSSPHAQGGPGNEARNPIPAANAPWSSPANWLLTDTAGRLRSVHTFNYHHGWNQTSGTAQQHKQSGLVAQARPDLGTQVQPGFGMQPQQHPLATSVYPQSGPHSDSAVQLKDRQFEAHQPAAAVPQPPTGQWANNSSRTWQQQVNQQPPADRFHSMERSTGGRWTFERHQFPPTLPNQNIPSQPRMEFPYFSRGGFSTKRYQMF